MYETPVRPYMNFDITCRTCFSDHTLAVSPSISSDKCLFRVVVCNTIEIHNIIIFNEITYYNLIINDIILSG